MNRQPGPDDPLPSAPSMTPRSHPPRRGHLFSSLRERNYRLFFAGRLLVNTGTWVQRIAQDWLVLTLTDSATAVGITTALQFLPTLLFGLTGGWIADRWPKRRVLLITQSTMGLTAAALAALTLSGQVTVWHVYVIACTLGTATAIDEPARQAFVNELVGPHNLRNAIGLNASAWQFGALIGPALSGALMANVGTGYAFAINALTYLAPLGSLLLIRPHELHRSSTPPTSDRRLREALRHLAENRTLLWPILLVGAFGLFTISLPVTLASYAKSVLHADAGGYGLLSAATAAGALVGALIAAHRPHTTQRALFGIGGALAVLYMGASLATGPWALAVFLAPMGATTTLLNTATNTAVQIGAPEAFRGRLMGVYVLVFVGSGALGGPLLGAINETFGPRTALLMAGAVPAICATILWLTRPSRQMPSAAPTFHRSLVVARSTHQVRPRGRKFG
ncbi:MFS transporter [Streptomyces sp. NPDC050400]|uniref:MFS transporter n=1 Tax=Streptomyces sp. NPDC050400 TaxID=3365610 RepID=UPI0037AA1558